MWRRNQMQWHDCSGTEIRPCYKCLTSNMDWFDVSGTGKLVSFSELKYAPVLLKGWNLCYSGGQSPLAVQRGAFQPGDKMPFDSQIWSPKGHTLVKRG